MDQRFSGETANDIPDRFYLNEMKREISDLATLGELKAEEFEQAATIVDIEQLGHMTERADGATPQEYLSIMAANPKLKDQLWEYTSQAFADTTYRRGYEDKTDLRASMVSASSAVIQLALLVDTVKVSRIGPSARTDFTNTYVSSIAAGVAAGLVTNNMDALNDQTLPFVTKLSDEAFKKTAIEKGRKSWAWAKTHVVAEALTDYISLFGILAELPELSTADTEMLRRQNAALGDASDNLATYTVKPAIGTLETASVETLFVDQEVHSHTMITSIHPAKTTPVKLFPKGTLTSSNVELVYKSVYNGQGGKAKRIQVEGVDGSVPHSQIVIYDNRELTVRGTVLTDLAEKTGNQGQAALLTAMLLGQKFDLTVPSYIVDLANEEAETIAADPNVEPRADKLRRLLIARTRVLNTLGSDIDQEMQGDEAESESQHRDIIKHGVVGHIRRIPDGYIASQSAHDLCLEELGVPLPDGHTYVKKHIRGNIDLPDKGHKMHKNVQAAGRLSLGVR